MLSLLDDCLAIDFPYDRAQVAEVKLIPGARWDRDDRIWRIPVKEMARAIQFSEKHGFRISSDVACLNIPPAPEPSGLTVEGKWIWFEFPWDQLKVGKLKDTIPGVTWVKDDRRWKAPLASLSEAVAWADLFRLPLSDELRLLMREREEKFEELAEASRSMDDELVLPGLARTPWGYQNAGARYAARSRRCFIADDMGLGKTGQAIMALELGNQTSPSYPAVVVCPPKLVLNWKFEYDMWLPDKRVVVVRNRKDWPEVPYDVVIVGWSNISHWVERLKKHNSYIFDESHSAKTATSERTKAAKKAVKSAPHSMRLLLTGTPITNRPMEYCSQLDILDVLDEFGGSMGFYRRYCDAKLDRMGKWDFTGHAHEEELNEKLRGLGLYIRREKKDALKDLPPVVPNAILIEGDGAAMKEYVKAEADIILYVQQKAREIAEELGEDPQSAAVRARMKALNAEFLVRYSVLRRLAAKAKMPFAVEWIGERLEEGKKVVIAAHHRDVVDELASRYGGLKIQGGQTVEEVEQVKKVFQETDAPVLVLSIQAGKEGHTLTAAENIIFVELPWTPADFDQVVGRLHRIGQKGTVMATVLLVDGTVDLDIWEILRQKREIVSKAVDGVSRITEKFLGR